MRKCSRCHYVHNGTEELCFSCLQQLLLEKQIKHTVATETNAIKHDDGKLPLDLLPFEALEGIAGVLAHGARKYSAHNWRSGFVWSRPFAACLRHLFSWIKGEDLDSDSGLHHLDHAGCELLFLISFVKTKTGKDDRYVKTNPQR